MSNKSSHINKNKENIKYYEDPEDLYINSQINQCK